MESRHEPISTTRVIKSSFFGDEPHIVRWVLMLPHAGELFAWNLYGWSIATSCIKDEDAGNYYHHEPSPKPNSERRLRNTRLSLGVRDE